LPELNSYLDQEIDWAPCPERSDAQCAAIVVPVDYAHPNDSSIAIPIIRIPATDPSRRLGALTFPPGGPGSSGFDYVLNSNNDPALSRLGDRYDFIGWDPRGFGRSAAIQCLSDEAMDEYLATDFAPTDDAGVDRVIAAQRAYAEGCQRNAGELLGFVGVESVAKDIDVLSSALREDRLNFLGISYGTSISQHYAQQFPDRVGRMVLDSVDDPATDGAQVSTDDGTPDSGQEEPDPGFSSEIDDPDKVVSTILSSCAAEEDCPLGQDPDGAVSDLITKVSTTPIPLPDGRQLGISMLLTAAFQATYAQEQWSDLTQGIADALHNDDGTKLAELADYFNGRDSSGHYDHKRDYFWSVLCMAGDPKAYRKRSDQEIANYLKRWAGQTSASGPLFGAFDLYSQSVCNFWPLPPTAAPASIVLDNIPPILLVNNAGDPATTAADAQRVADSLAGSVLVLSERDDHDAFGHGSQCIDDIVVNYFFDGTLPPRGTRCN
jgi:pimeloyl-ACP methyl ester carboxylesterase